jgi:hypothetical protein
MRTASSLEFDPGLSVDDREAKAAVIEMRPRGGVVLSDIGGADERDDATLNAESTGGDLPAKSAPAPELLPAAATREHVGQEIQVVVERMELAREQLAKARSVEEAKQVADGAAAIVEWLKRQSKLGLEIVNDGLLLKLQAEARMGGFLAQPGALRRPEDGRPTKVFPAETLSPPTLKVLGIGRKASLQFREVYRVPAEVLRELADAATRCGRELTREAVLKVAVRFRPRAPVPDGTDEAVEGTEPVPVDPAAANLPAEFLNSILTGDARELSKHLPDGSVALCLADPVYEHIQDYAWLAKECERVLVPGGNVIVQCGNLRRFECERAMRASSLTPVDLIAEVYPYALGRLFPSKVHIGWKPWIWLAKGPRKGDWLMNRVVGRHGKPEADVSKNLHPWGDAEFIAMALVQKLCRPGDLVWDPFTGSGVVPLVCRRLGFPFTAFEVNPATAETARERLAGTRRETNPQQSMDLSVPDDE